MKFSFADPWLRRPSTVVSVNLPEEMKVLAQEIAKRPNQREALQYVYDALSEKYRGYRILTFMRLDRFLITEIGKLWRIQGFLHCNHMNYLRRTLLLASGKFAPEAIEARWTQIWLFSPHQYLIITLENGERVEVDLWGRVYGIPFGSHAHGFQGGSFFAKIGE